MKTKIITLTTMLISSIVVTIAGLLILINPLVIEDFIVNIIQVIVIILGMLFIISTLCNKEKREILGIIRGILYILLGILIEYKIKFIEASVVVITGFYAFINFSVQLIASIILYKNKTKIWRISFLNTLISLFFSAILIFYPLKSKVILEIIAGTYLIFVGISKFITLLIELLDKKTTNKLKSKIRIRLPVIYTALIPQKLLEQINTLLKVDSKEILIQSKSDEKGELEIFIHLSKEMANGFGHVDICFDDKIYSYGTYDQSSNRLFKFVSDGVLIEAERDRYIEISTKKSHLVSYVLKLNSNQHKAIESKIQLIKKKCVKWYCKAELFPLEEHNDNTSQIYLETNCKFYKFKSGYFKTYFVFTTNCVKFADAVICAAGIGGININGIITPGVYFKMLNELFKMDNSIVVRRNIYRKLNNL